MGTTPATRVQRWGWIAVQLAAGCSSRTTPIEPDSGMMPADASGPPAVRPIAPLSTATVTSRRPTFRWELRSGSTGARVEIYQDRACSTLVTTFDSTGAEGRPEQDLPPGMLYWRLWALLPEGMADAPGPTWQLVVGRRSAPVDTSYGALPDVNGDGFADVIVGAPFDTVGGVAGVGRVYLFYGGPQGVGPTPAGVLDGRDPSGQFGHSVAPAGDVNGDGYADIVISAWAASVGGNDVGRVYVFAGSADGLVTEPLSVLTGPASPMAPTNYGDEARGVGDLNGDGYAEVAVGAVAYRTGADSVGRVYIYGGGPMGPRDAPLLALDGPDGAYASFGNVVAPAGDVNGDGLADLLVGAWRAEEDAATFGAGRAHVFLGNRQTVVEQPGVVLTGSGAVRSGFGEHGNTVGDVDGDGYTEVVVTEYGPGTMGLPGAAYLFHGGPAGIDVASRRELPLAADLLAQSPTDAAGLGDVDGDGLSDLALGMGYAWPDADHTTGAVLAYSGASLAGGGGPSTVLRRPIDEAPRFGYSAGSPGDVDGDGLADLCVGSPAQIYPDMALSGMARVFVYAGSAGGVVDPATTTLTAGSGESSSFGYVVGAAPIAPPALPAPR